jgi:conjugative relaxase-like TrwC/TraI family protein
LAWALTGDPGLADCHDVAVRAVVDELERFGATTRVRANGAPLHPDTRGLTVAAFRQTTSRADDPQLHTHVVVSAKVQTEDGRWLALDARLLKGHQRALGGLYQSVLRAELTNRYGVGFTEIVNGQAEIAGVPPVLLERFSKRTVEIERALHRKLDEFCDREGRDPIRFERAALEREAAADTRAHKSGHGVADLRARWLAEAADVGVTPDTLVASINTAASRAVPERAVTVESVVETLSTKSSAWHRMDVLVPCATSSAPCWVSVVSGGWRYSTEPSNGCSSTVSTSILPAVTRCGGADRMDGRCGSNRSPISTRATWCWPKTNTSSPGP